MELSEDQRAALDGVRDWYTQAMRDGWSPVFCADDGHGCPAYPHTHGGAGQAPVFALGGLAGTGKSSLVMLVEQTLGKVNPALTAPTHKAAGVLRTKAARAGLAWHAGTYHALTRYPRVRYFCRYSSLETPVTEHRCPAWGPESGCEHSRAGSGCRCPAPASQDGRSDPGARCGCPHRFRACGEHQGMACGVDHELRWTLREAIRGHHALIVVDEASMLTEDDVADVRSFGIPVLLVGDHGQLPPVNAELSRWMADPDVRLEVNHRQTGQGREIAELARRIRSERLRLAPGMGDGRSTAMIARSDAQFPGLMERFVPDAKHIVVTWTNATRTLLNHLMRGAAADGGGDPVRAGDRVVCLDGCDLEIPERRGETAYVYNGELGTVLEVGRVDASTRTTELTVKLDDPDPDNGVTRPTVRTRAATAQFGTPKKMGHNDPRRPSGGGGEWESWDYGYALTAHKAQGSEYESVIVIDESPMDYQRWMYTAVTRAAEKLIVVSWNR